MATITLKIKNNSVRVCVLGASGFIGSALCDELEINGIPWVGITKTSKGHNMYPLSELTNEQFSNIIKEYPYVINALGNKKPRDFEREPEQTLSEFIESNFVLQQVLSDSKLIKFVNISSGGTVYGEACTVPHKETSPLKPISWYGRAKAIEESLFYKFCGENDVNYINLRVTNPYGNKEFSNHGFIDVLINHAHANLVFKTFKSNKHYRNFIHIKDLALIVIKLLIMEFKTNAITINVGSDYSDNLAELIDRAKSINPNLVVEKSYEESEFDVINSAIDNSVLKELLGPNFKFRNLNSYILSGLKSDIQK